jgi:serine/threonine protein kinase
LCLHLKEGGLGYARELTVVFKLTNCLWIYGQDVFEQRLSVEFRTEVDMLSQVDHLNLVKLIGYMEENSERILVVEYVPNGNLREHLDGTLPTYIRSYGGVLDMSTRLDIAIDVAHALTYLHLYAGKLIFL